MEFIPFKKRNLSDEVKENLYQYIKAMDIKQNTKLPPEDVIAKNLGVSRVTVRKALTDLEQEGVVFRIHGKGTFVNPEALQIKVTINQGREIQQMIIDSGYKSKVEVVNMEVRAAGYKTAEKLQIKPDDMIVVIEKIFYADEHPAVLCVDMLPVSFIGDDINDKELALPVFHLLRKRAGKIISWDKVEMYISTKEKGKSITSYVSYMENEAFLVFETTNYDQDNNAVFFDYEFYDTNYIRFNVIRPKNVRYNKY